MPEVELKNKSRFIISVTAEGDRKIIFIRDLAIHDYGLNRRGPNHLKINVDRSGRAMAQNGLTLGGKKPLFYVRVG